MISADVEVKNISELTAIDAARPPQTKPSAVDSCPTLRVTGAEDITRPRARASRNQIT